MCSISEIISLTSLNRKGSLMFTTMSYLEAELS